MDTQSLITALREFEPQTYQWQLALYNAKKGRDGVELTVSRCGMQGIASWIETLVAVLLEKTLTDRAVTDYSPFLPKEDIGMLDVSDPRIKGSLFDITSSIEGAFDYSPEDFLSGLLPKITGYAFYGTRTASDGKLEKALFMRRTNPFLTGQKTLLCTSKGKDITESEHPLLKFMPAVDFLMLNGSAFFLSQGIEKDFDLENRSYAVCAKHLEGIASLGAVSDYEKLEGAAMTGKHAKKFQDFDRELLAYIMQLSVLERIDYLGTYGITVDPEGKMDTRDPEECEMIIDLLCRRSCLDAMGRLSVGSKITPR